jgi:hypothetical protein
VFKVTMIEAGSVVFVRQIVTDVLAIDGLDSGIFAASYAPPIVTYGVTV